MLFRSGSKDSYGPRETFDADVVSAAELWPRFDFAKIDAEGAEADILCTMTEEQARKIDVMCEVRDQKNKLRIWKHFNSIGIPMWSQTIGWRMATSPLDLPASAKEGSLFIGMETPFR